MEKNKTDLVCLLRGMRTDKLISLDEFDVYKLAAERGILNLDCRVSSTNDGCTYVNTKISIESTINSEGFPKYIEENK